MAKICVWGDNHWSQYSSIVRGRGKKYSARLENSIASLNWAEHLALATGCDFVVCTGDFFDAATLKAEEITALQEVQWNSLPKYFLVGNHEMGRSDLEYSTTHLFSSVGGDKHVVAQHSFINIGNTDIIFLPYILEKDRKPLHDYMEELPLHAEKRIIISHNDIKDVQMGQFRSQEGFSLEEIQQECDRFLNGHLHNGMQIAPGIINVGNLTGQNFSEDAEKYEHVALVVNTDTLQIDVYVNPEAYNFYKCVYPCSSISFKPHSVVTVKVHQANVEACREALDSNPNIEFHRLIVMSDEATKIIDSREELSLDHISEFKKYVLANIGTDETTKSELSKLFT